MAQPNDADEKLRAAVKAVVDASEYKRAAALLAVLEGDTPSARIVDARERFGRR